jgi:hypothetical protein
MLRGCRFSIRVTTSRSSSEILYRSIVRNMLAAFVGTPNSACTGRPRWLHREAVLSRFGRGARARARYRSYVEEAIRSGHEESPLKEVRAGFVLGGQEFMGKIRARIRGEVREQPGLKEITRPGNLEDILQVVSKHKGENWVAFRRGNSGREIVLWLARRNTMISNRETGRTRRRNPRFGGGPSRAASDPAYSGGRLSRLRLHNPSERDQ